MSQVVQDKKIFDPAVLVVALAAGALPYSGILDPYFPGFIPAVFRPGVEAGLGALLGTTALDYVGGSSLHSFDRLWKERFILAASLGALAASFLAPDLLGIDFANNYTEGLAAFAAVFGSYWSPYHIIQS